MRERPITTFRPGLEQLEQKQPLSASATTAPLHLKADGSPDQSAGPTISALGKQPTTGFLVYRRTNPTPFNDFLAPPFGQVLVQAQQPVPGQVYNVLSLTMRNGTAQTFNASSGLSVKLSGQTTFTPILTGNETWSPGQEFIFYVLTKKYYPLPNEVTDGFVFDLGGAKSVAIPGPSGIFLRLKYNPATFARQLDAIVSFGQGSEGGAGIKTGIADTAIYEFVSAKTDRKDFGGYF